MSLFYSGSKITQTNSCYIHSVGPTHNYYFLRALHWKRLIKWLIRCFQEGRRDKQPQQQTGKRTESRRSTSEEDQRINGEQGYEIHLFGGLSTLLLLCTLWTSHIKSIVHEIHRCQESRRSEVARYFKGNCKHVIVVIFFGGGYAAKSRRRSLTWVL